MPKRTFQPKVKKIKRKAGFRARSKSKKGKKVIKRRRTKGRSRLAL